MNFVMFVMKKLYENRMHELNPDDCETNVSWYFPNAMEAINLYSLEGFFLQASTTKLYFLSSECHPLSIFGS